MPRWLTARLCCRHHAVADKRQVTHASDLILPSHLNAAQLPEVAAADEIAVRRLGCFQLMCQEQWRIAPTPRFRILEIGLYFLWACSNDGEQS